MNNVLNVSRKIPIGMTNTYLNSGFVVAEPATAEEEFVVVSKNVTTQTGKDEHTSAEFRKPYLIQSGSIRRPLGKYDGQKLTHAVSLDYMGSAEFEWGAPAMSLRRVQAQFQHYKQFKFERHVVSCGEYYYVLRVFGNFDSEAQAAQYEQWLIEVAQDKIMLKDSCGFEERRRQPSFPKLEKPGQDFWWDIRNDVFFSFDKNFMNRMERYLKASFEYMDAPKENKVNA